LQKESTTFPQFANQIPLFSNDAHHNPFYSKQPPKANPFPRFGEGIRGAGFLGTN